jgi:protein-S-isoprenylcysteine O-methyltransferase Ste14
MTQRTPRVFLMTPRGEQPHPPSPLRGASATLPIFENPKNEEGNEVDSAMSEMNIALRFCRIMTRLNDIPGRQEMSVRLNHFIDSNKGLTFAVILGIMPHYQRWDNPAAWVYLALHGTYGILWVMKTFLFPDANWTRRTGLWFGLVSWGALMLYWIPAWLLISRDVQVPYWLLAVCISVYTFGVFFVFAGDMQKYTTLKLRPETLITDGMFGLSRNINYFGELLIYLAFAILPMTIWALIPLAAFIVTFWIPNMIKKEKHLAKLPGFREYKQRTRSFFPFLF